MGKVVTSQGLNEFVQSGKFETIKAGAQLLNTHAEAAHHKEEAEMTIKAAEKAEKSNGADNG